MQRLFCSVKIILPNLPVVAKQWKAYVATKRPIQWDHAWADAPALQVLSLQETIWKRLAWSNQGKCWTQYQRQRLQRLQHRRRWQSCGSGKERRPDRSDWSSQRNWRKKFKTGNNPRCRHLQDSGQPWRQSRSCKTLEETWIRDLQEAGNYLPHWAKETSTRVFWRSAGWIHPLCFWLGRKCCSAGSDDWCQASAVCSCWFFIQRGKSSANHSQERWQRKKAVGWWWLHWAPDLLPTSFSQWWVSSVSGDWGSGKRSYHPIWIPWSSLPADSWQRQLQACSWVPSQSCRSLHHQWPWCSWRF